MKKRMLLMACAVFIGIKMSEAQVVSPIPQKMERPADAQSFQVPVAYTLVTELSTSTSYALKFLKQILPQERNSGDMTVVAGVYGGKSVSKYKKRIPEKAEGYYLSVEAGKIVIAGRDERGLYYGIQTLSQLLQNGKISPVEIQDYPDIAYRGVVEGFYGTPWSHEARMRQLEFYGQNKMNTYLYGPKDDPYHSVPNWRKPYPQDKAEQIKMLVKTAHENGVRFYWAIHPGGDIKWNEQDRDLLLAKFESMYSLGVRAFAVFFDDIAGEGTKAEKQAELLNYIDDHFVQPKKDVAPLVMCPTEYNKAWSNVKKGYLTTLGTKLNPSIQIMWTGNSVIACIDKSTMDWINPLIKRKAFIWWNFPVSDYVRDHLLMGAVYGNGTNIKDDMSGFVSNPMEYAEASKIALYSVADYTWNMESYDSLASWNRSMDVILPGGGEYLRTFASHSSALGPNGHGFSREESVELQPALKQMLESYQTGRSDKQALQAVGNECKKLGYSSDILLANTENKFLIDEIEPWVRQAKLLGEYGLDIVALVTAEEAGNKKEFEACYLHAKALSSQMYALEASYNQNPYQPGVKVGSQHLLPSLNKMFALAVSKYNEKNQCSLDAKATYIPFSVESNVPQLSKQPVHVRGRVVNVSPSNEVIAWADGAYVAINMEFAHTLSEITFDLGIPEWYSAFVCEISNDGQTWTKLALKEKQQGKTLCYAVSAAGQKVKHVRLINKSKKEMKVYFKQFRFIFN